MDRIAAWNIRGMNHPQKQQEAANFVRNYRVGLFALLENKLRLNMIQQVRNKVAPGWESLDNLDVCPIGRIWVLWKQDILRYSCWADLANICIAM